MYCLHLQAQRISQASKKQVAAFLLLGLFFNPEDGGGMFLQNGSELPTGLYSVILEDGMVHNHCCENIKSYISQYC
jgi:hypothetical protein